MLEFESKKRIGTAILEFDDVAVDVAREGNGPHNPIVSR
jgi:hypothetical protein